MNSLGACQVSQAFIPFSCTKLLAFFLYLTISLLAKLLDFKACKYSEFLFLHVRPCRSSHNYDFWWGPLSVQTYKSWERGLCSFTFVHQLIWVQEYQLWDFLYISNENIAVHKFWWKISPTGELESLWHHQPWQGCWWDYSISNDKGKTCQKYEYGPLPSPGNQWCKEKSLSLSAGALGKQFTYFWGPISLFWHYPIRSDQ